MNLTVAHGGLSGQSATMTIEPDATAIDVLNALKEADAFGIDPAKERYVVVVPKTRKDMLAETTLQEACVTDGDTLIVTSSETGY